MRRTFLHSALVLVGLLLGYRLATIPYGSDESLAIGLPLPWAAWETYNGIKMDFASPLSPTF